MKKWLLVAGCVVSFVYSFGQSRDSAAARVLAAPRSHPVSVSADGLRVELRGAYDCEGLLWLSITATNRSAIDFRGNNVRVSMRSRKSYRRRARQEIGLRVVWHAEPGVLQSDSTVRFCVAVAPRIPRKEQEIVVEWVERDGDRRVVLSVRRKRVLRALRLR